MALVKNQKQHLIEAIEGPIEPNKTLNIDLSNPYNAQLLAEGSIVVTDGTVAPPGPAATVAGVSRVVFDTASPPSNLSPGVLYVQIDRYNNILSLSVSV